MSKSDVHPKALRHQFGGVLRRYRDEQDLTQDEIANRFGLSPRYTAELQRAEHNISLDTIGVMAAKLSLTFV